MLDKTDLPKHPYSRDNRPGLQAPDFDLEEVDLVFLQKSQEFIRRHTKERPDQPFFLFHSAQAVHLPSFPADRFKGKTKAGPHGDFIFELDHVVGELLKTLEKTGSADNTLVIFTSDNGPETGSVYHMRKDHQHDGARPWRGMKRDNWEGGHRVPFIVRWPGKIPSGSRTAQTICVSDIMATCAAIVGAKLPNDAAEDSVDLSPILKGTDDGQPLREFTLHQTISLALAIRQGDWKYLDHGGSGGNRYEKHRLLKQWHIPDPLPAQLYNLADDPAETKNLLRAEPMIAKRLKAKLDQFVKTGRSGPIR